MADAFDPMVKMKFADGWGLTTGDGRSVAMFPGDTGVAFVWDRDEVVGDDHIPEFDASLKFPNCQPVFRRDGKVVSLLTLSNDAALATRLLLDLQYGDEGKLSAGQS